MEEKRNKTRSKTRRKKNSELPKPDDQAINKPGNADDNGRFDFGGLPERDLKKNLGGCG